MNIEFVTDLEEEMKIKLQKEALSILNELDIEYIIQFQRNNNRISFYKDNICILIYPLSNIDTADSAIFNLWSASKLLARMKKYKNFGEIDYISRLLLDIQRGIRESG